MNGLNFIFYTFMLLIYALICLYYYSARKERHESIFEESRILIYGGMGYILMLFYNTARPYGHHLFYAFAIISLTMTLMIMTGNLKTQTIIPPRFYMSVLFFGVLWVVISINSNYDFYQIILPLMLIQAALFFFMGLIYLLYEEFEISMRNLSGILFILMTMVKLFYVFDFGVDPGVQINGLFKLDFSLYLLISFVIVVFEYNQSCMMNNSTSRRMVDNIQNLPIGIMELNARGDILSYNETVRALFEEATIISEDEKFINLYQITKIPFEEKWTEIIEYLGKGSVYTVEADFDIEDKNQKLEFVLVPNLDEINGVHVLSTITTFVITRDKYLSLVNQSDFSDDEILAIPNKYKLMELFDKGVNIHHMNTFGVILVKVMNYSNLTTIVNSHETATIDRMIVDKLSKLSFIYCVGKVSEDTFEVMTVNTVIDGEIHKFIQYIKDILSHQSFYDNDMNVYNLDYRIGVAMAPEDGFSQRELLKNATIAITKAGGEDKGYVQFFNEHIRDEVVSKLQLETKLRDGIFGEQLFLEFQPQFRSSDQSIRGFEALVRWRLPDGHVLMPNEFISLAEEVSIIDELGEWVLAKSIEDALLWNRTYGKNWILSVNISVLQLEQEGFTEQVISILEETGYPAHLLELEVTETKMARSSDRVFLELNKLHEYGVKIAIDDFGTGYSSLDYLRLLPFDLLKIDRGFIERIHENDMDHKILESIIDLVDRIDMECIAEGVETQEQLDFLQNTSCDYIQGYVYSRPMTSEAIIDLISEAD